MSLLGKWYEGCTIEVKGQKTLYVPNTGANAYQVKSAYQPIMAHQAGTYPGFYSMKRLGVFLLPPGWDASPSQA